MAMLNDFTVGDGAQEYEPLPPGEYVVIVESMELKDASPTAKDPNGKTFKVEMQVIDGDKKGRKVYDNWTYLNQNQVAQNIGRGKITSLSKAVGYADGQVVRDTDDLLNKPCVAVIDVQAGSAEYKPKNVVKWFKALSSAPSTVRQQTTKPKTASEEDAPWGN